METGFGGVLLCILGIVFFITMIILTSSIRIVREDTRLSVYRLGRSLGDKGPGLVLLIPLIDRSVLKNFEQRGRKNSQPQIVRRGG